jgi:hypothetical protein
MGGMAAAAQVPGKTDRSDFADLMIGVACGFVLIVTTLLLAVLAQKGGLPSSCDFASYWATGQQLAHHANPYDASVMGDLERTAGYTGQCSYYMRNPPWALPLVLPLGYVSARIAVLPWSLLMLGLLFLSVQLLQPVLGLSGWQLRLHRTRPLLAGAALWLCTLKPHLFLPFGVILLVWIILTRSYRILLGAATAAVVSCLAALWIDPAGFSQYWRWAHDSGISAQPVPCLGVLLRRLIDPGAQWLVFVPAILACAWALAYFWPRRASWDWIEHGSLLMLVSIVAAPYCFLFDQSLALPAVLYAASRTSSRRMLAALAVLYLLVEIVPWFHFGPTAYFYSWLWQAPAWLAWYVLARRSTQQDASPVAAYAPTAA